MTPEQKQRIEQIRKKREQQRNRPMLAVEGVAWDDVDFLLSFVKSQEAEIELLRRASADPEDRQYGATVYDGNGNYSLLAQNAIDRNVTETRSACVEKVKGFAREYQKYETHAREDPLRHDLYARYNAAIRIINALETLSIEQPKE